jgi:hypothetical protein
MAVAGRQQKETYSMIPVSSFLLSFAAIRYTIPNIPCVENSGDITTGLPLATAFYLMLELLT